MSRTPCRGSGGDDEIGVGDLEWRGKRERRRESGPPPLTQSAAFYVDFLRNRVIAKYIAAVRNSGDETRTRVRQTFPPLLTLATKSPPDRVAFLFFFLLRPAPPAKVRARAPSHLSKFANIRREFGRRARGDSMTRRNLCLGDRGSWKIKSKNARSFLRSFTLFNWYRVFTCTYMHFFYFSI